MTLDDDIVRLLRRWPGSTAAELGALAGVPRLAASRVLHRLSVEGMAAYIGRGWHPVDDALRRRLSDHRRLTDRAAAAATEAHRLRYLARPATVDACAEAWGILPASASGWLSRARRRGVVVSEYLDGLVTWRAR